MRSVRLAISVCALGVALSSGAALAAESCDPDIGRIVSLQGSVEVQRDGGWQDAALEQALCREDTIRVGARSRAALALVNDAVLRLDQNTTLQLLSVSPKPTEKSLFSLVLGAFQSFSRKPREFAVNTPYLNGSIEGTEFVIRVAAASTTLTVFEGRVAAENPQGRVSVAAGQSAVAEAGQAPQARTVVRPRDAVQWSLYYPPVLAVLGGRAGAPAGLSPVLTRALEQAGGGDIAGAFNALDAVPQGQRDAAYHLHRAALLLHVGQIDEARGGIERALARDANDGLAYALRAVISVAQNRVDDALADGAKAVSLNPRSAAAKIALSYALQAGFELEAARDTLDRAVTDQPGDALAWARLSELWLALGHRGQARRAADKAAELAPELARVHIVRGFAALAQIRTTTAKAAFRRAITLDSADPLPRLGLGLAKIRDSNLDGGRREIEAAVALDSRSGLLRAYLGKAYFEEKRAPLDGEQLAIAKQLDPQDPTAYLYDAIRKQTENRPGEALADLLASIARNDNRAVYRGRLQLDQDRAARGTSLARVYDDLGFQQPGLNEASKSLTLDPTNASAHRFLADIYGGFRRREIARVSEALQAKLLQDININPVQPSLAETNLNIVTGGGPAEAGFNEFTPLFESNGIQFSGTGQGGNHGVGGGEAVISGVYDWFSASAGAFHFQQDGFRDNNEVDHDIYDIFAQAALTPDLNIQAEFRRRDSREGDLALNFDPDQFLARKDRNLDQDVARLGARYSPTPNSDVLVSVIYSDLEQLTKQAEPGAFGDIESIVGADDRGYQAETQYLYRRDRFNLTAGFGYARVDSQTNVQLTIPLPFPPPIVSTTQLNLEVEHFRGYVYANVNLPSPVTWTLGVSYDRYEEDPLEITKINPKFGVQWNLTDRLRLRGAVFQTVKPALVSNRTVEPTQVAGFNQFFDDANATDSFRYGIGIDWRPIDSLFLGAEGTRRDIDQPVGNTQEDRDEHLYRAYLHWTPIPELALNAAFVYDRFESVAGLNNDRPRAVDTYSAPVSLRYFHRSGLFAGVGATYVHQQVHRSSLSALAEGDDSFVVVDAAMGYRFPKRHGVASLEIRNLLNSDFKYQDDSYREFGDAPTVGPYIPELSVLARLTLNF